MTYVIHGATGAQGGPVAAALVAAGKSVVALTRKADVVVPGARVVAADASSVAELTEAYRGAEGVFVHLPVGSEDDRLVYARNVVDAVRAAQPARVVFSTSGFPVEGVDSVSTLVGGLADSGVSHAVIAPELFLENLLLPPVIGPAREQGVLGYPLPVEFEVSWASHLDIADAAVALLERTDVSGVVAVGQYPAVTGPELAEAFSGRLGREVVYRSITSEEFGASIAPLIGEGPATGVAENYRAMAALPGRPIEPERSAQKLLGVIPRNTSQWLADIGLA